MACENRIRQQLLGLYLSEAMEPQFCTPNEALEEIQDKITVYTPQKPKNQKSKGARVKGLYKEWSKQERFDAIKVAQAG